MAETVGTVIDAVILTWMLGCIGVWLWIGVRRLRGYWNGPLVPLEIQPEPFWTPLTFVLMIGIGLLLQPIVMALFSLAGYARLDQQPEIVQLTFGSVWLSSVIGVTVLWIGLRYPAGVARLRLWPRVGDVWLGLKAAFLVLPILMLMMNVLNYLIPYRHDALDALQADPSWPRFAVLFVATTIITPVVEEFAIRVLLQGSLQRLADSDDPFAEVSAAAAPLVPRSRWPIVVASLIFAGLHGGQGAAPIPLFFMALALGYLYRQTGRMTASVVLHMVLNGITMIAVFAAAE